MPEALHPPVHAVRDAVARALAEDLTPLGDLTAVLVPAGATTTATFGARAAGVLAGTRCAAEAFAQVDPSIAVTWSLDDGDTVEAGSVIGTVVGPLASVLTAERTALNFLGHLSGVATATRRFVDAAAGGARVWDTRKTTPGLRSLEKAAVRAGGGANHRGNLSDWVLVKDNHLSALGVSGAVAAARDRWPGRTVHIECDTVAQAVEAIEAGADALLLDNMALDDLRACVAAAASSPRRPLLEASGGITLESIGAVASTGVDMISVGAITNSAPVLDIGLDIGPAIDQVPEG